MSELVEQVVSSRRNSGLDLRDLDGGWFALHGEAAASPTAFLFLNDSDIRTYLDAMSAEDVDGAFGPNVELAQARYFLLLLHLEEAWETSSGSFRYVVIEQGSIRVFGKEDSLPVLPPGGDYQWRAAPN